ncbi:MAG TPA: F0F1 ATP synthase subunit A [Terriglobales bacterium]|nr:F0F1 ATP synthase subunit A [Terriglobales bacterium]
MPEQLWFTALLNHLFAGPVDSLLRAFHLEPHYPQAPIPNGVAMEVLVFVFLVTLFALVRTRLSVEDPGALQHVFEGIHGFIDEQSREIIGHDNHPYVAFLTVLGLFILCSNLLGLVPGMESPTAVPVVPLGCAVLTFIYYQAYGFRRHGIKYLRHFAGPSIGPWWANLLMGTLMVPIEIVSHLARMLSLTVRLFANMFAGDMVTLIFFSLVPIAIPVAFMALHIGVSLIQAYVFVLLAMVYLAGAVGAEH